MCLRASSVPACAKPHTRIFPLPFAVPTVFSHLQHSYYGSYRYLGLRVGRSGCVRVCLLQRHFSDRAGRRFVHCHSVTHARACATRSAHVLWPRAIVLSVFLCVGLVATQACACANMLTPPATPPSATASTWSVTSRCWLLRCTCLTHPPPSLNRTPLALPARSLPSVATTTPCSTAAA